MSPFDVKELTRREWRELGFYYDRDETSRDWRVVGSKAGLECFADALERFATNPRNETLGEHDHLGPYMYLKIGTWSHPQITDDWIAGPLPAMARLASLIRIRLSAACIGDIVSMRDDFAPSSAYNLILEVRPDDFDPVMEDGGCQETSA